VISITGLRLFPEKLGIIRSISNPSGQPNGRAIKATTAETVGKTNCYRTLPYPPYIPALVCTPTTEPQVTITAKGNEVMVFLSTDHLPKMDDVFNKSIHQLKRQHPHIHYHYDFNSFFHFDHQKGTVTDWNDSRNILASEDFIIGLIEGLEEEVGSAASLVMYNIGKDWGTKDAAFFEAWYQREYQQDLRQANLSLVLETWWWPFTAQGWGNWDVDLSDQKNGFMFVNIFDSAVARTLGDVGKPVCHIYAGLFAGFFSSFIQKQLNCIEIQCYAMGETYCKFLLGKRDRIDAATFWTNEGATARDIEKRLRNGEYLG
jgi:uncharacterized protein